jgi:hypothetical protein
MIGEAYLRLFSLYVLCPSIKKPNEIENMFNFFSCSSLNLKIKDQLDQLDDIIIAVTNLLVS